MESSLLGKAVARGAVRFDLTQIRDFATDKHRTVDDTPYGGGEGMLLKADVLQAAWEHARTKAMAPGGGAAAKPRTILMSPQGAPLTQSLAEELAGLPGLILVCGHYEGVDERFIDACVDQEVSIGDYVLTGGELPAMVLIDSVTRVLPGVVGNEQSVARDSLGRESGGLLKYPQYTRPREFQGVGVPEVLLSGDHQAIARWRRAEMESRTRSKRPDLWAKRPKPS